MKKTFIALAVLASMGAVHAQTATVAGGTTDPLAVTVDVSNVGPFGPHKPGYPGIALGDANYIDLDGISMSYLKQGTVAGYDRYYLPGYAHAGPGGTVTSNINWARVSTSGEDVFFGLVASGITGTNAAFYVGDRASFAMPSGTTNYTVGGLLALPSTSSSAPITLSGTLSLVFGGTPGTASLSGNLGGLAINPTVANNVNIGAGTFGGASTYGGATGTTSGHFYGTGATGDAAVAGIASGGSGSTAYVASFGGKN